MRNHLFRCHLPQRTRPAKRLDLSARPMTVAAVFGKDLLSPPGIPCGIGQGIYACQEKENDAQSPHEMPSFRMVTIMSGARVKGKKLLAFLAAFAMLGLAACNEEEVAEVGAPAPQLVVLDTKGNLLDMSQYEGRPLVLNFWLGGCAPCLDEMDELQAFYRQHGSEIGVLSVNYGTSGGHVEQIAAEHGVSYDLAVDEIGMAAMRYGVVVYPTTWLVDSNGILRDRIVGGHHESLQTIQSLHLMDRS